MLLGYTQCISTAFSAVGLHSDCTVRLHSESIVRLHSDDVLGLHSESTVGLQSNSSKTPSKRIPISTFWQEPI